MGLHKKGNRFLQALFGACFVEKLTTEDCPGPVLASLNMCRPKDTVNQETTVARNLSVGQNRGPKMIIAGGGSVKTGYRVQQCGPVSSILSTRSRSSSSAQAGSQGGQQSFRSPPVRTCPQQGCMHLHTQLFIPGHVTHGAPTFPMATQDERPS